MSADVSSQRRSQVDWTSAMTFALIDKYQCVKVYHCNHGNLRKSDYESISKELTETWGRNVVTHQTVKYKIENLKNKYNQERTKSASTGGIPSNWEFFDKFHEVSPEEHRYAGVTGGLDEGVYLNSLPRQLHPRAFPQPANQEAESQSVNPEVESQTVPPPPTPVLEADVVIIDVDDPPEDEAPPLSPRRQVPPDRGEAQQGALPVSPRIAMCNRPGVSGQRNKKRKTRPEENAEMLGALTKIMDSMIGAWKTIEGDKLNLLKAILERRDR